MPNLPLAQLPLPPHIVNDWRVEAHTTGAKMTDYGPGANTGLPTVAREPTYQNGSDGQLAVFNQATPTEIVAPGIVPYPRESGIVVFRIDTLSPGGLSPYGYPVGNLGRFLTLNVSAAARACFFSTNVCAINYFNVDANVGRLFTIGYVDDGDSLLILHNGRFRGRMRHAGIVWDGVTAKGSVGFTGTADFASGMAAVASGLSGGTTSMIWGKHPITNNLPMSVSIGRSIRARGIWTQRDVQIAHENIRQMNNPTLPVLEGERDIGYEF